MYFFFPIHGVLVQDGRWKLGRHLCMLLGTQPEGIPIVVMPGSLVCCFVMWVGNLSADLDVQSSVRPDILEKKCEQRCHSCAGTSILEKLMSALLKTSAFQCGMTTVND